MGVGRILSRGGCRGYSQNFFSGGAKSSEIWFLLLEIEKNNFFANDFEIQGGQGPPLPPFRRPWVGVFSKCQILDKNNMGCTKARKTAL